MRLTRPPVTLALAVILLLAVAAFPAHAALIAETSDPPGDATSPEAGHDLLDIGLGYDRREGRIAGAFRLRGEPETGAFVSLVAATRDASGACAGAAVGLGTFTDRFDGQWHRFASPTQVLASGELRKRGIHAAIQSLEVDDEGAAGVRPDCLIAEIGDATTKMVYDRAGPVSLVAHPSLAVKLDGVPETVKAGRSHRLRVTVSNPGDAPTGKVRVRLAKVKGTTYAKRTLTLKSIAAGASRSERVRVRFGKSANTSSELEARVEAGDLRVDQALRVFVRKPSSRKRRGGGGNRRVGSCVQFFPDLSGQTGGSLGLVPCPR